MYRCRILISSRRDFQSAFRTELLRLPYWNPTHSTPVDVMHNLFLGLIRFHCRDILRLGYFEREKTVVAKDHEQPDPVDGNISPKEITKAREALRAGATAGALRRFRLSTLRTLCEEKTISLAQAPIKGRPLRKLDFVNALLLVLRAILTGH